MFKFYKDINAYAKEHNMCRQVASKRIKNGEAKLVKVPKGFKYMYFIED